MPNSCNIRRHITKNYYSRVSYYNKSPHNYYAENYYSRASNFLWGLYLFLLILMPFLKEIALFSLIISFSWALILDMIWIIITYYNTKWIWTSYNRDETIKLIPTKPEKQLIKH
jgi:hypothetical protein